jgi:catechol 2,3-dioxygenase
MGKRIKQAEGNQAGRGEGQHDLQSEGVGGRLGPRRRMMGIERVGHVVLKVRDLEKAKAFYVDFLGMKIGNYREGKGMFLRFGDYHHDIALLKTGDDADLPKDNQVGLVHVALITDGLETIRAFYNKARNEGVTVAGTIDHAITMSLYLKDPDGNTIELYAETEYDWRNEGMGFLGRPFDIAKV